MLWGRFKRSRSSNPSRNWYRFANPEGMAVPKQVERCWVESSTSGFRVQRANHYTIVPNKRLPTEIGLMINPKVLTLLFIKCIHSTEYLDKHALVHKIGHLILTKPVCPKLSLRPGNVVMIADARSILFSCDGYLVTWYSNLINISTKHKNIINFNIAQFTGLHAVFDNLINCFIQVTVRLTSEFS